MALRNDLKVSRKVLLPLGVLLVPILILVAAAIGALLEKAAIAIGIIGALGALGILIRKPSRLARIVSGISAALLLVMAFVGYRANEHTAEEAKEKAAQAELEKTASAARAKAQQAPPPAAGSSLPSQASEDRFVATLRKAYVASNTAADGTGFQKAFQEARQFDRDFFGRIGNHVQDWDGEVLAVEKLEPEIWLIDPSGGSFHVSFKYPSLSKSDPRYQLANQNGACVRFSGTVDPQEKSTTQDGAVQNPEYEITFSELKTCPSDSVLAKRLDPFAGASRFWTDTKFIEANGERCPDGLWALFPDRVPGSDEFERRANAKKARELAGHFKGTTFLIDVGVDDVKLGTYDFSRKAFPLQVKSTATCEDDLGNISFAVAPARVGDELADGMSDEDKREGKFGDLEWHASPLSFRVPIAEESAKAFRDQHGEDFGATIAFRIAGTQTHKRVQRDPDSDEPTDYGAGRLIKGQVVGVLVRPHGGSVLIDTAPKK